MMRDGGVSINDAPKTHCENTVVDDHVFLFDYSDLWIPLQLNGVLSCFHTRVLTKRELHECEKLLLTPYSSDWNSHYQSYERNE